MEGTSIKGQVTWSEGVIRAVLARGDTLGCTADEVAAATGRPDSGRLMQARLEELVAHGSLDRWGIGRGALYRLTSHAAPVPCPRPDRRLVTGHAVLTPRHTARHNAARMSLASVAGNQHPTRAERAL